MEKNKTLNMILKIVAYLIGYPALLAITIVASKKVFENGASYGIWAYIGLILLIVFMVVFTLAFLLMELKLKKKGGKRAVIVCTTILLALAFFFSAGLWMVLDSLLPDILGDATSGTIHFTDLQEDYNYKADEHGNLLDMFITWNYENLNLANEDEEGNEIPLETYLEQGYKNPRVQELLATNFKSIDKNGYASFVGPWLNLADGKRLTIPVLIHLIFNEREFNDELPYMLNYIVVPTYVKTATSSKYERPVSRGDNYLDGVHWSILDMDGGVMEINVDSLASISIVNTAVGLYGSSLLGTINDALDEPELAGTPIYIGIDISEKGHMALTITPAVYSRGVWDYKRTAWLNSNNLLFAVISLFPLRQWMYAWSGIIIFTAFLMGFLWMKDYGKCACCAAAKKKEEEDEDEPADDTPVAPVVEDVPAFDLAEETPTEPITLGEE